MARNFQPPYLLRISKKARRASLRVTLVKGLGVVLPVDSDPEIVPEMLNGHRAWIERQLKNRALSKAELTVLNGETLPPALELKTINECWRIEYLVGNTQKPALTEGAVCSLHLNCQVSETAVGAGLLRGWLRKKACSTLISTLDLASKQTGLKYQCARIKSQRTRWGSCSAKGIISLNDRLLFLPSELTHYVMIHELCHTRQLNHSPKFWALVAEMEPAYRDREAALRQAWRFIPLWLET